MVSTLQDLKNAIKLVSDFQSYCDNDGYHRLEDLGLEFDPYNESELLVFIEDSPTVCQCLLNAMSQQQAQRKEIPSVIDLS